jgi:hypothetical protein
MNRRQFLKAGLLGGAALVAGGAWVVWRDIREAAGGNPPRDHVAIVVGAVAPVMLDGVLASDADRRARIDGIIEGVKTVISAFPIAVQGEIADLFGLLDIRAARRALTGVTSDWSVADPHEIAEFLDRWRHSRLGLLQSGYFALHDLILGAWYADSSAWDALGYAGPPTVE